MKSLVLRFDIDTYRCIAEGVPNLLRLGREESVAFTFFCNMGRAISRMAVIRNILHRRGYQTAVDKPEKLSSATKLGLRHLVWTLVLNPRVGASHPNILRQALEEKHDIALHGGNNHGVWQHGFRNWSEERIRREISAGKTLFDQALGRSPELFSSPGWESSDSLNSILKSMGFKGSADRHGPDHNRVECADGFCTLPTNLVAEPGGVAYFESFAARGCDSREIVRQFQQTLTDNRRLYVLYDHPCFAGVRALNAVRDVVRCAAKEGVEITTFSQLVRQESGC